MPAEPPSAPAARLLALRGRLKMLPFCAMVRQLSHRVHPDQSRFPILIVDDDEPTQNLLRAVFRRFGYPTEVASNGREAIARLNAKAYAAVILDVMMPEAGGHEVVAFLRAAPASVPVVICSAAGPAALAGFDSVVVKAIVRKPFDIDELVAAVTAVAVE